MIVGLAGPYCSGKDEVANFLASQSFEHIDVDKIGHWALDQAQEKIIQSFGSTVLHDKRIDRSKLSRIVFLNTKKLRQLEKIVHPIMKSEVEKQIQELKGEVNVVINAAILLPMGLHSLCDTVLWVKSRIHSCIFRAKKRNQIPLWRIFRILWIQRQIHPKFFHDLPDTYTVQNYGTRQALIQQVSAWMGMRCNAER